MKKTLAILALCFLAVSISAQEFKVPQNYVLEEASDYAEYEEDIINCVDWLIQTPANQQEAKRKEAGAFLISWLSGSPNVSVEINAEVVNFANSNHELLLIFMGGWTKYVLETDDTDPNQGNLKGIESVITFYKANRNNIKKDKTVEKYIKLQEEGKLEKHLQEIKAKGK